MKEPIIILIILFILAGLAYGPYKKSSGSNTKSTDKSSVLSSKNKSSSSNENAVNSSSYGTTPNKYIAEDIKEIEKDIKKLEENISKNAGKENRSPYYGKVTLSNISGLNNPNPNKEYIRMSTKLKKDETVNITGWSLRSEKNKNTVVIGQASLLPFPFSKVYNDVVLQYRDVAILTKGFSPIGISFRTNKCTGYFEEDRTFTPGLQLQCPKPGNEDLPQFSTVLDRDDECVRVIKRLPRCTTVKSDFLRDLPDTVPSSCKTYMETQVNYNSCVAKHFDDTDFPGKEYRIFFNKFGPLWRPKDDVITLYDREGLVVDTIDY